MDQTDTILDLPWQWQEPLLKAVLRLPTLRRIIVIPTMPYVKILESKYADENGDPIQMRRIKIKHVLRVENGSLQIDSMSLVQLKMGLMWAYGFMIRWVASYLIRWVGAIAVRLGLAELLAFIPGFQWIGLISLFIAIGFTKFGKPVEEGQVIDYYDAGIYGMLKHSMLGLFLQYIGGRFFNMGVRKLHVKGIEGINFVNPGPEVDSVRPEDLRR